MIYSDFRWHRKALLLVGDTMLVRCRGITIVTNNFSIFLLINITNFIIRNELYL